MIASVYQRLSFGVEDKSIEEVGQQVTVSHDGDLREAPVRSLAQEVERQQQAQKGPDGAVSHVEYNTRKSGHWKGSWQAFISNLDAALRARIKVWRVTQTASDSIERHLAVPAKSIRRKNGTEENVEDKEHWKQPRNKAQPSGCTPHSQSIVGS